MSNPLQVHIVPRMSLKLLRSPIWSIPIAVILIVGAFLVKVSYDTYNQVHEAEYRLLDAHARYADPQIAKALGNVDHLLTTIAEQQSAHFALRGEAIDAAVLATQQQSLSGVSAVLLTDAAGHVRSPLTRRSRC